MPAFEPQYAISKNLVELSRKELCELVAQICRQIKAETGNLRYHGGVYPENISRNADGVIAIGTGKTSDWADPELNYIAPEIYWNNRPSPQSDVYALGLLLYYGASAGKLPFEGESRNAQLMRMSGKPISAPASAGKHLCYIIEKALRFKESERYQTVEELAIMLDYCEDNRLLNSKPGAEVIFRKQEEDLSDMEQLMLGIIQGKGEDEAPPETAEAHVPAFPDTQQTEDEIFSSAGLRRPKAEPKKEEEHDDMKDLFGLDEPDPRDPAELEAEEDIRVYEPSGKQGIPILTEEKEPELAPVTLKGRKSPAKQKQAARQVQRQAAQPPRKEETPEQKKRPFLVVLMLLSILIIAAIVAKILIDAFSTDNGYQAASNVPAVSSSVPENSTPTESMDFSAIMSEEQIRYQQELEAQQAAQAAQQAAQQQAEAVPTVDPATLPHHYEAVKADVGWLEARDSAIQRGGYLVTINTSEELEEVIRLAQEAGFERIWIGAHREDGEVVWESGEENAYYIWDDGEPSYTDRGDGAAEDYVMLWYHNGKWVYNDSRENPLTNFYGMYGGKIGYVVEIVG